jgi:hypothetical protein
MTRMSLLLVGALLFIAGSASAQTADVSSYSGTYYGAPSAVSCEGQMTVNVQPDNLMITSFKCFNYNRVETGIFLCDDSNGTCAVDNSRPQNICPNTQLLLLTGGNILISNPCSNSSIEMVRQY